MSGKLPKCLNIHSYAHVIPSSSKLAASTGARIMRLISGSFVFGIIQSGQTANYSSC